MTTGAEATSNARVATPPRTRKLLEGPIAWTLLTLAAPNILVAASQTAVAIADAWYVGHLGIAPLAALALVFPIQQLMNMMSAGAMGGGISSAVARALGAGDDSRARRITVHALIIAAGMAALFTVLFAVLARPVFAAFGGTGEALDNAVAYAEILFGCAIVIWLANTLASLIRGTGNMSLPGAALTTCSLLGIPLSGALTLGWAGLPGLGIIGPPLAFIASTSVAALVMLVYLASGRTGLSLRFDAPLDRQIFSDILKVGALACGNALFTVATVVIVTALVARYGTAALAGYGLGSRLELLLVPITSSVGIAMTAMVGANRGAKAFARARRIAWIGGLSVLAGTGVIGLVAAIAPDLWIGLFTTNDQAAEVTRLYFRIAGGFFGLFGLGQALYFATQGTGNMAAPFTAGFLRLALAGGIGTLVSTVLGAPLAWLFACVAAGLALFGGLLSYAVWRGKTWNPEG
jgi:putative MATE family efflux protein